MGKATQHNMLVFTKKYGKYMLDSLNGSAIYFPVMLSQASLESGYGTSNAAKNKNNFFGVMYNGVTKKFSSPKDAFEKQVEMFYKPNLPYAGGGVITANDPYQQARRIADAGYYSKLKGFIDDALYVLPLGKINDATYAQAGNLLTQKTTLI